MGVLPFPFICLLPARVDRVPVLPIRSRQWAESITDHRRTALNLTPTVEDGIQVRIHGTGKLGANDIV